MTPYFERDGIVIFHGDCREILPTLAEGSIDLVLADPPYGISYVHDVEPGSSWPSRFNNVAVHGDNEPFDPTPFLCLAPKVVLWGANHYADKLPVARGWIVWDKRVTIPSNDQSDCEMAWTNFLTVARVHRQVWSGFARAGMDRSTPRSHPTQKPVELMLKCIQLAGCPARILDPFMGVGTTLVAAKMLGRRAIGIEIEDRYCEVAANRLRQAVLPFDAPPIPEPAQLALDAS